jgi:integral membrane protein
MSTTDKSMHGVFIRFRVMAVIAGVMSLLLWFVDLPAVYLIDNPSLKEQVSWIPYVHGYTYPFYVLTAIHLAAKMRWSVPRMIALILAGTLPLTSFIAERRLVRSIINKSK